MQLGERAGQDQLIAVLGNSQALMRKIQSRLVSRAIALLGICWSSSVHRAQIGPIVQSIVVQGGIGGIGSDAKYKELKSASVKGDFHLPKQIQQTQNKTAKQHRNKIQELIAALFEETTDPMLDEIKGDLFHVAAGGPIVAHGHRVMVEMMALPAPAVNGVHPSPHTASNRMQPALHPARPAAPSCSLALPRAPSPLPPPPPHTPSLPCCRFDACRLPRNSLKHTGSRSVFLYSWLLKFRGSILQTL
jgi:hypothetical protein